MIEFWSKYNMSSNDKIILNNGNIGNNKGRHYGSKNKTQLELQRIGEENAIALLQMHVDAAFAGDKEAREFLLGRILPKAPSARVIEVDIPSVDSIDKVRESNIIILNSVKEGKISPEEGEKLFSMTEHQRKAIETMELEKRLKVLEDNMNRVER